MVCPNCKWDPKKKRSNKLGHRACIKRNKGKEVKDCDCQCRSVQPA